MTRRNRLSLRGARAAYKTVVQPEWRLPLMRGRAYIWLATGIFLSFIALGGLYSLTTPAWEAPDEVAHFEYITHLLTSHTLPVQRTGHLNQAHQPPLYYLIAAIAAMPADLDDPSGKLKYNAEFTWADPPGNDVNVSQHTSDETFPFRGQALALHLARGVSVLMGMITVMLTLQIAWHLFPEYPLIGLVAAGLVAFNPQFLFITASVNNDSLLVLTATGSWWQLLRTLEQPEEWHQWTYTGLWIGAAILAKPSAFVIGLVAAIVLVTLAFRSPKRVFMENALALAAPVAIITGWWFVRNQMLYGDPLGWNVFRQVYSVVFRKHPLEFNDLQHFFTTQINSFWGVFGWNNVYAPSWFYTAVRVLGLVGLCGLGAFTLQQYTKLSAVQRSALALMVLAIVAQESYMLWSITRMDASWYQGRYLFPIIGPAMVLTSIGLVSLFPRRLAAPFSGGIVLLLASVAIWMPFKVISPAYQSVPLPKWKVWFVPHKTAYTFGGLFELKGYEAKTQPDISHIDLTLYWEAAKKPDFDYSVFVHMVDESGQMVAQKDHAPGIDQDYPPTTWWTGDIIADEHTITPPPELGAGTYSFRVGVYRWDTGERLQVESKDKVVGNYIVLEEKMRVGDPVTR